MHSPVIHPREGRELARACVAALAARGPVGWDHAEALRRALYGTLRTLDIPSDACPHDLHPGGSDGVVLHDVRVTDGTLVAVGWSIDVGTQRYTPMRVRATKDGDGVAVELRFGLEQVTLGERERTRAWRREPPPGDDAPWCVIVQERVEVSEEPSDWGRAWEAFLARPGRWKGLVDWARDERVLPIDRDFDLAAPWSRGPAGTGGSRPGSRSGRSTRRCAGGATGARPTGRRP